MSSPIAFRGAFTALITPFQADGSVDEAALRALVRRQIDGGIKGLVPCGTTGEAATMTEDERLQVIETVVSEAGGQVPIIAGTGSNDTAQSVAFTRKVAAIDGVDAALVVTPYYNKPGQPEMIRHFRTIADEGDLPVVLYNVPGRTAVSLSVESVVSLSAHPQVVAIKEASADMVLDSALVEALPREFALLSGDDFTTFPFIAIGGHGCISVVSNIAPTLMSDLCTAALRGDLPEARRLHGKVQPIARALFEKSNPIPVKTAAHLLGWCGPTLRGPLYEPGDAFPDRLRAMLAAAGLTDHS
jgi:4-hydroxy-tetrahydrodipicolinate synthase